MISHPCRQRCRSSFPFHLFGLLTGYQSVISYGIPSGTEHQFSQNRTFRLKEPMVFPHIAKLLPGNEFIAHITNDSDMLIVFPDRIAPSAMIPSYCVPVILCTTMSAPVSVSLRMEKNETSDQSVCSPC